MDSQHPPRFVMAADHPLAVVIMLVYIRLIDRWIDGEEPLPDGLSVTQVTDYMTTAWNLLHSINRWRMEHGMPFRVIRLPSSFEDVKAFHRKFGLIDPEVPQFLTAEEFQFRSGFLAEELDEFCKAHTTGDLVKAADSLVDLAYVALGTSARMGLPHDEVHQIVHAANMKKKRAQNVDESKRGSTLDVVKPEGWEPPDNQIRVLLAALLGRPV